MRDLDRNCVLSFDEMHIKKCFDFHPGKQIIEGFEDLGPLGRKLAVGTRVLVFMVRGLFTNWKQPIAFFITKNGVTNANLGFLLDTVLDALHDTGLKIRAVVSDQGTSNQSMAQGRVTIERPHFSKNGQKIYFFFDYLHLFKNIRNNLSQKKENSIHEKVEEEKVYYQKINIKKNTQKKTKKREKVTDE